MLNIACKNIKKSFILQFKKYKVVNFRRRNTPIVIFQY